MSKITASHTILELHDIFATLGSPDTVVTDNGPAFTSSEFRLFMSHDGIKHITLSPYHPSSNGLAERSVQTFKRAMVKNQWWFCKRTSLQIFEKVSMYTTLNNWFAPRRVNVW